MKSWLYAMPLIALYPDLTRAAGMSAAELTTVSLQIFVMVTLVRVGLKWHHRRETKYRVRALTCVALAGLGVYFPIKQAMEAQNELHRRTLAEYASKPDPRRARLPGQLRYLQTSDNPEAPCSHCQWSCDGW